MAISEISIEHAHQHSLASQTIWHGNHIAHPDALFERKVLRTHRICYSELEDGKETLQAGKMFKVISTLGIGISFTEP